MVRLDKSIADLVEQFILVRIVSMRGVDLNRFDFDYDQELAILFQSPAGVTFGRFHAPSSDLAEQYLTLPALRHAMEGALQRHAESGAEAAPGDAAPPRLADHYPAAGRLPARACIHCHQVHEFQREAEQAAGRWKRDDVWIYPLPENIGLTVDVVRSNHVREVRAGSPAHRAGVRPGAVLREFAGRPIQTIADLQYALHHTPAKAVATLRWEADGRPHSAPIELADGWRRSDVSWRGSLKTLGPSPLVDGEDLSAAEKQQLGLRSDDLAFRQHAFPPQEARQAGIRPGDIILGLADQPTPARTARQFRFHLQLHYDAGTQVTYRILRGGQRTDVPVTLPRR